MHPYYLYLTKNNKVVTLIDSNSGKFYGILDENFKEVKLIRMKLENGKLAGMSISVPSTDKSQYKEWYYSNLNNNQFPHCTILDNQSKCLITGLSGDNKVAAEHLMFGPHRTGAKNGLIAAVQKIFI